MAGEQPGEREVVTEWSAGLRWLPVQASVKRTITKRYRERSEEFIKDVELYAGVHRERVSDEMEGDAAFADAYLDAGAKAGTTSDRQFRAALARLVAAGMRSDVDVDEVAFWVTVMRRLEPAHLRFLAAVGELETKKRRLLPVVPRGPFKVPDVAKQAHMSPAVGRATCEHLVHLGLVSYPTASERLVWTTSAGRALLAFCSDFDEADLDRESLDTD